MSGSTDAAFRRQAMRYGAPIVVSEMVAGEALAAARDRMLYAKHVGMKVKRLMGRPACRSPA